MLKVFTKATARLRCCGAKPEMMDDRPVWERISTAPYDRDLELAVIEEDRVHPLVFACRRAPDGWIKVATRERIFVHPTHWRPWQNG
jgi:hypothetical protein